MFLDQEKTGQECRNLENGCHLPTRTRQVSQQCNNVHTISCVYVQSESAAEHFPPLNMLRIVNFKIILQLHHPLRSFRVLLPFSLRQKAENQQSELCYQDKLQGIMQYFSQLGGGGKHKHWPVMLFQMFFVCCYVFVFIKMYYMYVHY